MRISFQGRTLPRSRLAERSGEPRPAGRHSVHRERQWLGKRGLYGSVGGVPPGDFEQALLWVLNYCDGEHDLLWIAERSRLGFARIAQAAAALEAAGLVREIDAAGLVRPIDQVGRGELQ
jgi:winged helix-turn-helix